MNKQHSTDLNIGSAFEHFWRLPDWITRSLIIGGIPVFLYILYMGSYFLMIIPIIGWIIGAFGILAAAVGYLVYAVYSLGYRYEVTLAVAKGEDVAQIQPLANMNARLIHGLKILAGLLVYYIPVVLMLSVVVVIFFIGMIALVEGIENGGGSSAEGLAFIAFVIVFVVAAVIISVLFYLYHVAVDVAVTTQYAKNETISSILQFNEVWELVQKHFVKLLLIGGLGYAVQMGFLAILSLCYVLILLCVGILLIPIAYAIYFAYKLHFHAHLMGQFIALTSKEK